MTEECWACNLLDVLNKAGPCKLHGKSTIAALHAELEVIVREDYFDQHKDGCRCRVCVIIRGIDEAKKGER